MLSVLITQYNDDDDDDDDDGGRRKLWEVSTDRPVVNSFTDIHLAHSSSCVH
jgi:hypothetical protein